MKLQLGALQGESHSLLSLKYLSHNGSSDCVSLFMTVRPCLSPCVCFSIVTIIFKC